MYEDGDNPYWVEIPRPEENGSYGGRFSFDEIVGFFKALPAQFTNWEFETLQFLPWKT